MLVGCRNLDEGTCAGKANRDNKRRTGTRSHKKRDQSRHYRNPLCCEEPNYPEDMFVVDSSAERIYWTSRPSYKITGRL